MIESTSNTVRQWYCIECREWKSAEGASQCIYPTCSNRNPSAEKELEGLKKYIQGVK